MLYVGISIGRPSLDECLVIANTKERYGSMGHSPLGLTVSTWPHNPC